MKDEKKAPKLRFKGFTDDWEQRKFSDIYKKSSEKNDLSFSKDEVISVANNKWGIAPKNSTDKYMRTYYVYRIGDIAFEGNKSKNFKFGRFVENTLANGIVSHVFDIYRPIQKEHDLWFWKYYIHNETIMQDVLRKSTTKATMMTNLVNRDLLKQKLNIPILDEQKKIGRLFNQIDKTITLHEEKHRQLEQLKKALLQKMFADETGYPVLRFKGFTEKWEQRKLGETVVNIVAGGDINKAELLSKGKYPVYANALTNNGIVGYYASQYRIAAPAVTVTGRGDIGIAKARDINFTPVVRLLAISSQHNNYFLENLINTHRSFAESTGVPQLTVPQLSNYKLYFPSKINEEVFIGRLLKKMDHLTALHQHKIDNLKSLKRTLLQKMFV